TRPRSADPECDLLGPGRTARGDRFGCGRRGDRGVPRRGRTHRLRREPDQPDGDEGAAAGDHPARRPDPERRDPRGTQRDERAERGERPTARVRRRCRTPADRAARHRDDGGRVRELGNGGRGRCRKDVIMRFAANLTMLYTRLPFIERFAAARMDGFTAVEFVSPYEHSPDELAQVLRENDLTPVLFNLPAGDWAAGERGIAALPDRKHEFREGVERAIRFAKALGVTQLNCLAGAPSTAVSPREVHDTLVENLAFAAAELARHDIRLLLEPVNDRDVPGFAVATVEDAVDIIAEVGSPNLFLQYDLYHAQV